MILFRFFFVFLFFFLSCFAEQRPDLLSLEQAMSMSQQHSPTLNSLKYKFQSARMGEVASFLKYGPTASFSLSHGWPTATDLSNSAATSTAGISVSQSLTGIWKNSASVASAHINRRTARMKYIDAQHQSALLGATSFLNYQLSLEQLSIAKASLKTSEKNYNDAQARWEAGDLNKDDFLKIKLQYSKGQLDLSAAQSDVISNKQNLCFVLGVSDCEKLQVTDLQIDRFLQKNSFHFPDINKALAVALQQNVVISTARNKVTQAAISKISTLNSYVPDLSFSVGYSSTFQTPAGTATSESSSASLSFKWNFFDSGNQFANFLANRKDQSAAQEELRQAKIDLQKQVIAKYYEFKNFFDAIAIAKASEDITYETLNLETIRFQNGQSSALDYVTAQDNYNSALAKLLRSTINFQISYLTFQTLLGETPNLNK